MPHRHGIFSCFVDFILKRVSRFVNTSKVWYHNCRKVKNMNPYMNMLENPKMTLIMSLPKNDPALCRAAFEAGADAVKVHINVEHRASGSRFGRLCEEKAALEEMIACAKGPMGLMIGASVELAAQDVQAASEMGFDFFSIYAHHVPVGLHTPRQAWMIACDGTYSLDEVAAMQRVGAQVLEASIMPGAEYGDPLSLRDVLRYSALRAHSDLPIVVPSQRAIRPEELTALRDAGMNGVMIGAVVTGQTEESIRRSIAAFRNAIDRM